MSSQISSLINQRIAFCVQVAGQLEDAAAEPVNQVWTEALLYHLVMAYRCYLYELAEHLQLTLPPNVTSIEAVIAAWQQQSARAEGVIPGELGYLQALEQPGAWLASLLQTFDCQPVIERPAPVRSASEIRLHVDNDESVRLDAARCKDWLKQLQTLIEQQRPLLDEW